MIDSQDFCLLLTTTDSLESAQTLAHELVTQQLIACCSIIPGIISVYKWQEEIHQEQEYQLVLKTTLALQHQVEQCILQLHPYEVPEIIQVSINSLHEPYAHWMQNLLQS